jgi:hypothetical protein
VLIERDFVAAAYAMRKLLRLNDVPPVLRRPFPVRRYESCGHPRDAHSLDDIAQCYDFENSRRGALSVPTLCDEILQSSVFAFCCGETADLFDGVYLASDQYVDECVHLVLASDFIALCADAGAEAC